MDGKILRSAPNGAIKEHAVQDILKLRLPDWYSELESFPGPLGRIETSTTEAIIDHLQKVATGFEETRTSHCTLDSASKHPHSAALACQFLIGLLKANGRVQSDEFWQHFSFVLAKRAAALQESCEPTALQKICARLARGEVLAAVEDACEAELWSHALVLSRLISEDLSDRVLLRFTTSLARGKKQADMFGSTGLTPQELADPFVRALLLLYETLGKGSIPEIPEATLPSWPAIVALFALLLRPCDQRSLAVSFIEALAAKLAAFGDIFGAHVCYLLTGERTLEAVDAPSSLVCLLGVEHRNPKHFSCLLEPLPLQLSETYEYAMRCGNPDALCPTIQPFKLAHAMLLADVGLTEKARRYMTLLQAFVKAIPQNRLSDAFRSSMRDFNETLNPNQVATSQAEAPRVGKMVKDLFRGFAETTGLAVKPTPPPALPVEENEQTNKGSDYSGYGGYSGYTPYSPPQSPAEHMPLLSTTGTTFAPSPPLGSPPPSSPFSGTGASGPSSQSTFAPAVTAQTGLGPPPMGGFPAPFPNSGSFETGVPPSMPLGTFDGSPSTDGLGDNADQKPKRPERMDYAESLESDPLLNAGKAVLGFGKSLFSAMKGGIESKPDPNKQSQANKFFYDKEKGIWRQEGVDVDVDPSAYDPMTGKKLMPQVTEPPPPPPPSMAFGGPPPTSSGLYSGGGLQRGMGAAALYVNPMMQNPSSSPASTGFPMGTPPMANASPAMASPAFGSPLLGVKPPMGSPIAGSPLAGGLGGGPMQTPLTGVKPLASPFGGQPQNQACESPLATPFGQARIQPGGVRSSPFG